MTNAAYAESNKTIYLRLVARRIEVLEEALHGMQERLGLLDDLGCPGYETHVNEFMLRHQRMLGISDADASILRQMAK